MELAIELAETNKNRKCHFDKTTSVINANFVRNTMNLFINFGKQRILGVASGSESACVNPTDVSN